MDAFAAALAVLRDSFRERCRGDAAELRSMEATGALQDEACRKLVHGLSGAGATFGFPAVSARAAEVEALQRLRPLAGVDIGGLLNALDDLAQRHPT